MSNCFFFFFFPICGTLVLHTAFVLFCIYVHVSLFHTTKKDTSKYNSTGLPKGQSETQLLSKYLLQDTAFHGRYHFRQQPRTDQTSQIPNSSPEPTQMSLVKITIFDCSFHNNQVLIKEGKHVPHRKILAEERQKSRRLHEI